VYLSFNLKKSQNVFDFGGARLQKIQVNRFAILVAGFTKQN
jgi:hypothetical protein